MLERRRRAMTDETYDGSKPPWQDTWDVFLCVVFCCLFIVWSTHPYLLGGDVSGRIEGGLMLFAGLGAMLVGAALTGLVCLALLRHASIESEFVRETLTVMGYCCLMIVFFLQLPSAMFVIIPAGLISVVSLIAWFLVVQVIAMERGITSSRLSRFIEVRSIALTTYLCIGMIQGYLTLETASADAISIVFTILIATILMMPLLRTEPANEAAAHGVESQPRESTV